jgi:hypothetical protein
MSMLINAVLLTASRAISANSFGGNDTSAASTTSSNGPAGLREGLGRHHGRRDEGDCEVDQTGDGHTEEQEGIGGVGRRKGVRRREWG